LTAGNFVGVSKNAMTLSVYACPCIGTEWCTFHTIVEDVQPPHVGFAPATGWGDFIRRCTLRMAMTECPIFGCRTARVPARNSSPCDLCHWESASHSSYLPSP
jgi:hypothetical protein